MIATSHRRTSLPGALIVRAATVCVALGVAGIAWAQKSPAPAPPTDDVQSITVGGQTVSIDPRTGRLRPPTTEEARAIAQALLRDYDRSIGRLNVLQHDDGMLSVELPESYMDVMVLTMLPGEIPMIYCVQGEDNAERLMQSLDPSAPAPAPAFAASPVPVAKSVAAPSSTRTVPASAKTKSVRKGANASKDRGSREGVAP